MHAEQEIRKFKMPKVAVYVLQHMSANPPCAVKLVPNSPRTCERRQQGLQITAEVTVDKAASKGLAVNEQVVSFNFE
jgi:hypothetical protein